LVPCRDIIATGLRVKKSCAVMRDLQPLSHQVNEVIRLLDPLFYRKLLELNRRIVDQEAFVEAFKTVDILLMEGREFLFNKHSAIHIDKNDPQMGWASLVALGTFRGGRMKMHQLGLTVRFEPGDMVMLRGRVLKHSVEEWDGGQRISIPHFTHSSVWEAFGMKDEVNVHMK
jgi:hypothetical protein